MLQSPGMIKVKSKSSDRKQGNDREKGKMKLKTSRRSKDLSRNQWQKTKVENEWNQNVIFWEDQ